MLRFSTLVSFPMGKSIKLVYSGSKNLKLLVISKALRKTKTFKEKREFLRKIGVRQN